ncbi:PREDICTED: zinc finger protein 28-like [Papilio xuthus]|uniref:Zinc finger protein 28-like n=1 Tax=Papilio xuthus TaxID=66420 RepID=A0AAJ6ZE31_PAPXU|nr:PREDICTED: zinc finger protein 28-like [Papilio xuthus]
MMFDPPDFPYRDLSELRDNYEADDLFNNDVPNNAVTNFGDSGIHEVTNIDNQLSLHSNNSGRYFNIENVPPANSSENNESTNTELYVVQQDIFNFESTLLDDNIVNQFLLPLQTDADKNKDVEIGPDLLALHSCAVCHEIFTTEADLLDHTISLHASDNYVERSQSVPEVNSLKESIETNNENQSYEAEWLVCRVCERVLSTVVETESNDQLCCIDDNGRHSISRRRLGAMYVCDSCSYLFADGDALDRHRVTCCLQERDNIISPLLNTHISSDISDLLDSCENADASLSAEETGMQTVICDRPLTRQTRRPYSNSSSNKMWNCGSCNQLFATARELYRHKRGEDRPEGAPLVAYVCEECDKVLGSMCALHTHKKMHRVTKPGYPCRVCGRRFNQSGHLAIHMRMHTGERPYPCDLCPKAFKVKVERDDHRRTHTGERPFACTSCPKTFTAAARLREHARIHTDQRPYRCEICGAAFRRPYARTVHTLIHSGEKPHKCDVCGTAFRRSGDMWKHKRTLHGLPTTTAQ